MTSYTPQRSRNSERELIDSLEAAASLITKSYLDELERYSIAAPSEEDLDIDVAECGQFYRISKLVFNKDEHFLHKLTTVVNVAFSVDGSLTSIIKSDGRTVDYYLGILFKNNRSLNESGMLSREAASAAFRGAIQGNLIGSDIASLPQDAVEQLRQSTFTGTNRAVSSISGIVALRNGDDSSVLSYVQGIENLVDSLRGQKYTIVLIADPIHSRELQVIKQGYELLHTQLAAYWRSSLSMNETDSVSLSKARSEGIATGISKGIAFAQSKTNSRNTFISAGVGINAGIGVPGVANFGVSAHTTGGLGSAQSETRGETNSYGETSQRTSSFSQTTSTTRSEGRTVQLQYENRSVKALLDKIDKQLERLDICESFGAFDCAAYVIAEDRNAALTAASNYNALMRGEDSSVQASYINTWYKNADVSTLFAYLNSFVHPRLYHKGEEGLKDQLLVTPASIINGNEIAIQIGLPKKSVAGIQVIPMAPFGRNVRSVARKQALPLGRVQHMGQLDASDVQLDVQSLAAHTFITGSTGSGKSNTVYHLLKKLDEAGITFLVIEPAKGEYKHVFGNRPDVQVFGTNASVTPLLRLNPFQFPPGIHVLEHIDRLIEIFNVCWPMYAAMPAVLKEAIEDAYVASGWDLVHSVNHDDPALYPSFVDVMDSLQQVISRSAYSDELKGNYKGALLTRVRSLTNGLNGQILCNGELDNRVLFDMHTIIDLSRVGSAETKSLIMGILVMRLQEHRMAQGGMNRPLRHVTVLEEAHHLLKRASPDGQAEGANLLGKSVEMLANAIAEMRTYGEGFVIADQAPGLLDASVIRNTNTKILLQTPDLADRQLVGRAANLNEEQIVELAKLATGVAAVYQNNWLEPVLCRIEPYAAGDSPYSYTPPPVVTEHAVAGQTSKRQLVRLLLGGWLQEPLDADIDSLLAYVRTSALSARRRLSLGRMLEAYKQTKQLPIWELKRFAELSSLVADLVGDPATIEQIVSSAHEAEQLTEQISRVVRRSLGSVSEPFALSVCQCLLKDRAEQKEEWLKLYYMWDHHIRQRLPG